MGEKNSGSSGPASDIPRFGFDYDTRPDTGLESRIDRIIEPPPGAVLASRAGDLEKLFLARMRENIASMGSVYSPLDDETCEFSFDEEKLQLYSRKKVLRSIMERHELYESQLLKEMPHDRGFEYGIYKGLLGKTLAAVIHVRVVNPLETYVVNGFSDEPLPAAKLLDIERSVLKDRNVFNYVGIMSPTGVEEGIVSAIPSGPNLAIAVVVPRSGTAWEVLVKPGENARELRYIFDPESLDEKIARVRACVDAHSVMKRRNAFLPVKDAAKELALPERAVTRVFEEMAEKHDFLEFREIDGTMVLVNRQK
ncbi:MAG: hypothetical protein ACYS8W_09045 [Planctomycetota bacterium]